MEDLSNGAVVEIPVKVEKLEMCMEVEVEVERSFTERAASAEDWRRALSKVVPAVVVLRTTSCRAFDTESSGTSYATGFVVDKRRGIILTNRHVVKPGPVVAEAMFLNREEIPVYPIYRDPVHDFGFFRYDPAAVQYLKYDEIHLAPEAACVGLEIRVVGNDSGEKVSILAGTLARLDRDAPHYKKDGYNDFNTFYMQAASGTKGGSSGSPVIDWQGNVVALNAGSKSTSASAFFLPLDRVVRTLKILQDGFTGAGEGWNAASISRGTLQLTFIHKGFDETRRLGLRAETEQMVRKASPSSETGMLVVDSVVPGGPAFQILEPGDVLVCANNHVTTQFLKLETLLDDSVDQHIDMQIERGGQMLSVNLKVQNLHSITPDHFLQVSGAVIHPLSYQQARNFRFVCGLVYVAEPGYMLLRAGVPRHAIIKKFAGEDIERLDDFVGALSKLSAGARVPLEYITYIDRHRRKSVLVTMDRHEWYAPPKLYIRNDRSGLWSAKPAFSPKPIVDKGVLEPPDSDGPLKKRRLSDLNDVVSKVSSAEIVLEPALVMLDVHVPPSVTLDGVHSQHFFGTGVVVHHSPEMGLAVVDKNTIAIFSSDVMISFAAFPIEIHAEVVFLHPVHNYALVAYDPSALGHVGYSAVHAAELLPDPPLRRGDSVYLVGLSRSMLTTSRKSFVTNPCNALNIHSADCPRYRAMNMEVIELDTDFGNTFSGVLANEHGQVLALWGSFSTHLKYGSNSYQDDQFVRGIPVHVITHVVHKLLQCPSNGRSLLINGVPRSMPLVRILEVELYPTLLSKARSFGLPDHWVEALAHKDPIRRQVLRVKGCSAGSRAQNLLELGDMVLAVNGETVTCFRDIEDACHVLEASDDNDGNIRVTISRHGCEMDVVVGTDVRDGNGTTRAVNWCGCVVQDPHPAVRALGFLPEEGHGVYVARWCHGSPAHRYGLYALQWIIEINGKATPDLDAFVNVTKELEHGQFVRVRTVHLSGKPLVLTLKQDLHYWPTWQLWFDPSSAVWRREIVKALD